MLIDTQGKIVFKGHPANRPNLADDLSTLLKGEKITGKGCEPEEKKDGGEAADEPAEGFKEADCDAINKEMDEFRNVGAEMIKEVGKDAKGMMRDFCVLVLN